MSSRIMAHLVAGYPDGETSHEIARALIDGGCSYLEVQFPFSDPTADGIFIQKACDRALRAGFSIRGGFHLISQIRKLTHVSIFIMGYANTVFYYGVKRFLKESTAKGAQGLIIPDLPPDYDEGLFSLGVKSGLSIIPVICPTISDKRLQMILSLRPEYVYSTLRKGITGAYTEIGEDNIAFLKKVGSFGVKIFAGFGISTKEQVEMLSPFVHAAVVGSAFLKEIMENEGNNHYRLIKATLESLL